MADDVDPTQSLPTEAEAIGDSAGSSGSVGSFGSGAPSRTRIFEPVEIAMVEIEIVEFEAVEREPDADVDVDVDGEFEEVADADADKAVVELATLDVVIADDNDDDDAVDEEIADGIDLGEEGQPLEGIEFGEEGEPIERIEPSVEGIEPDREIEPAEALPTMADLNRVASELDDVDARLAALDEQRP